MHRRTVGGKDASNFGRHERVSRGCRNSDDGEWRTECSSSSDDGRVAGNTACENRAPHASCRCARPGTRGERCLRVRVRSSEKSERRTRSECALSRCTSRRKESAEK